MDCKKCNGVGSILLRGKDSYCESCFINNTNHKFRACIGKKKILSKNENVLVCLSGGAGSTVLLDLISNGLAMDSHKKLRITPFFLHVMNLNQDTHTVSKIIEQCKIYNFDVHVIHISEYMAASNELPTVNQISILDNERTHQFQDFLKSMPSTVHNDQLLKIKRSLFFRVSKQLECNFIFTAETTTTLAMNLLSNISLGRGSQVENDIGFCDIRNEDIKLLKPMKDISIEEIKHYMKLKDLTSIENNEMKENSLQSVIKAFVSDLQIGFPATISTVCKTADKLGFHGGQSGGRCIICESDLSAPNNKLTAFEATVFSRMVSDTPLMLEQPVSDCAVPNVNKSLFPFFKEKVCYGCSRNLSEMDQSLLPGPIKELIVV